MTTAAPPPVVRTMRVPLPPAQAFALFTTGLPRWWPLANRSVGLDDAASCHVEARAGGRLYERGRDGSTTTWGTFLVFEAPARVVFTWHPGMPADPATEVEVRFFAEDGGTRVELEHRRWHVLGPQASLARDRFAGGWGAILARYEALAAGADELPDVAGRGCQHPAYRRD